MAAYLKFDEHDRPSEEGSDELIAADLQC